MIGFYLICLSFDGGKRKHTSLINPKSKNKECYKRTDISSGNSFCFLFDKGTLLKPKGGEVLVKEGQESNITCEEAASTCPEGEDGRQRCRKESVIKYKGVTWYRNVSVDEY